MSTISMLISIKTIFPNNRSLVAVKTKLSINRLPQKNILPPLLHPTHKTNRLHPPPTHPPPNPPTIRTILIHLNQIKKFGSISKKIKPNHWLYFLFHFTLLDIDLFTNKFYLYFSFRFFTDTFCFHKIISAQSHMYNPSFKSIHWTQYHFSSTLANFLRRLFC